MRYPVPFGRHLLLERINVGGMAEVFKAKSFGVEGFERIVAVKRILPTMAEDEEFITMFVDEARIASHLTHQNIVQIYELGKFDNIYYISMEYVAGRDLRQILDHHKRLKKPMEVAKACYIASRVCEALEYAHKKKDPAGKDLKIIHRDVSPQNVIISFEGEVKLCDFGIAKAVTRVSRTQVGVLKGKFAYMSPEQVRGQATDRRSDLFALGVIFYEMLTGERLFLGESDYSTLEAVRNARVPSPSQYNVKIPPALEKIMLKLLARDPKDRYQWASEVHEDLLDHLVSDGKIFHGRHLRTGMQDIYARDIEIENAKLEEFMRLKLPDNMRLEDDEDSVGPSVPPVVVQMAESEAVERKATPDPAMQVPTNVAPPLESPERAESTQGSGAKRTPSIETTGSGDNMTETHPRGEGDVDGERLERSPSKAAGQSPNPQLASSPVSNLFGTPQLEGGERSHDVEDHEEAIVRPAESRSADDGEKKPERSPSLLPVEEPSEDGERTECDVFAEGVSDKNDTVFDPESPEAADETVSGDGALQKEIRAAQDELKKSLQSVPALNKGRGSAPRKNSKHADADSTETIDTGDDSKEYVSPFVFDPSEASITSEQELPPSSAEKVSVSDVSADDKTSVEPFPAEIDAETAIGGKKKPPPPPTSVPDVLAFVDDAPSPSRERLAMTGEDTPAEVLSKRSVPESNPKSVPRSSPRNKKAAREKNGVHADNARTPGGAKRRIWEVTPDDVKHGEPEHDRPRRTPHPAIDDPRQTPTGLMMPISSPETASARPMMPEEAMPLLAQRPIVASLALRDPRVLMLVAAAVGMLAIALLLTLLLTRSSSGASLHIVTEPVKLVEVKLDGKVISQETPVEASALKLGSHTVELHAAGYHAYTQVVQIAEPKPHTMVVPLEPLEQLPRPMDDPPPSKARGEEEDTTEMAAVREPPVKTVQKPVERPRAPEPKHSGAQSAPARASQESPPPKEKEQQPRPAAREEAPRPRPERTAAAAPPKVEEGFLVVTTKPTGVGVIIDGKKTNLRTPVRHPYPLTAGKHVLTFEMDDGQKYNFDVVIDKGETKKVSKLLR